MTSSEKSQFLVTQCKFEPKKILVEASKKLCHNLFIFYKNLSTLMVFFFWDQVINGTKRNDK
jgi:hypothetical protein